MMTTGKKPTREVYVDDGLCYGKKCQRVGRLGITFEQFNFPSRFATNHVFDNRIVVKRIYFGREIN